MCRSVPVPATVSQNCSPPKRAYSATPAPSDTPTGGPTTGGPGAIGHTTGGPDTVGHTTGGPGTVAPIKRIVTFTDIDMAANAIRIGIDPALAPAVPGGLMDPDPVAVTDETLQTKINEVTQQLRDDLVRPVR